LLDKQITLYGDGKQVRDVLHVDDLIAAYRLAIEQPDKARGQAFNIGGGPRHTLSLLELIALLEQRLGKKIAPAFGDWRAGDQKVYVSDISRLERSLGWTPQIGVEQGVGRLIDWVKENRALFA
jgi:CDP-paratose 2-epimerase